MPVGAPLRIAMGSWNLGPLRPHGGYKVHKSVKFCNMAGTAMPRSHRGMGVSPVNGPFGVQALACPAQCSLKAELQTCARHDAKFDHLEHKLVTCSRVFLARGRDGCFSDSTFIARFLSGGRRLPTQTAPATFLVFLA